uniref:C-type lectin domain-containing protein n=1 Tax=Seriola lalandi dorsalis TaxID=1841481 RepID=A0A3B4YBD2_SERLL
MLDTSYFSFYYFFTSIFFFLLFSDTRNGLFRAFDFYTNPPGQKIYTLIGILRTWSDAQTYCRTNHKDLAMIENAQENAEVMSKFPSAGRWWIGLYRVPWRWSDNSNSSFKNWQSGQPDVYYKDEHCVAENSDHDWADVMLPQCGTHIRNSVQVPPISFDHL